MIHSRGFVNCTPTMPARLTVPVATQQARIPAAIGKLAPKRAPYSV